MIRAIVLSPRNLEADLQECLAQLVQVRAQQRQARRMLHPELCRDLVSADLHLGLHGTQSGQVKGELYRPHGGRTNALLCLTTCVAGQPHRPQVQLAAASYRQLEQPFQQTALGVARHSRQLAHL